MTYQLLRKEPLVSSADADEGQDHALETGLPPSTAAVR